MALLAGMNGTPGDIDKSGAACGTPEFVDSLRTELGRRNIPERILFLPLALADQRADDGREGIWSLTALDAISGEALVGKPLLRIKGTGDVAEVRDE